MHIFSTMNRKFGVSSEGFVEDTENVSSFKAHLSFVDVFVVLGDIFNNVAIYDYAIEKPLRLK